MADQPSHPMPPEPTTRPGLQFSLTALFVVMTVVALALSAFYGVSRFFGVPASQLIRVCLGQSVHSAPRMIVWCAGLAVAVRYLPVHRKPAVLASIALTGFILAELLRQALQAAVIAGINPAQSTAASVSSAFTAMWYFGKAMEIICWILVLIAVFSGRSVCRPSETYRA